MSETVRLCKLSLYAIESCMRFIFGDDWNDSLCWPRFAENNFKRLLDRRLKRAWKMYSKEILFCRKPRCSKGEEFESNGEFKFQWIEESRKRPKNNKKSSNKAFWSHFRHIRGSDCWEKLICSSDNFGWGLAVANKYHKQATDNKSPQYTLNCLFPSNAFLPRVPLDSLCCMYLVDRISQLLRCDVVLQFINIKKNTWDIYLFIWLRQTRKQSLYMKT